MRDLLFLFIFDFIVIKGNTSCPRLGLLTSFTLSVKCLECAINPLLHWLLIQTSSFGLCQKACVFKAIINPEFHCPGILILKELLVLRY